MSFPTRYRISKLINTYPIMICINAYECFRFTVCLHPKVSPKFGMRCLSRISEPRHLPAQAIGSTESQKLSAKYLGIPRYSISGWWFGTCFIFPYIGNFIIPIDFHIPQRGGPSTNQIYLLARKLYVLEKYSLPMHCRFY